MITLYGELVSDAGRFATLTVVIDVSLLSRYPFIMWKLPGALTVPVFHVLFEVHDTVAPVAAPVASTSGCGVACVLTMKLFQLAAGMTPATSAGVIAVV